MEELFIDGKDWKAGRLASRVAKEALNGRKVYVFNAKHVIISGDSDYVIKEYKAKVSRGDPYHGPFYPKTPESIVKRIVRGMLPKKAKGREAIRRIRVFRDFPEEYKKSKVQSIGDKKNHYKFITLDRLSNRLGGK